MNRNVKKLIRTLQTHFPSLVSLKFATQRFYRNSFKIPFEKDFDAIELFPKNGDQLYLDVGGNRGQSIDAMLMKMPNCKINSFEPNPYIFKRLSNLFADDHRVTVYNVGLGSESGSFSLYVPSYNGFVFDGLASFDFDNASNWLKGNLYRYDSSKLKIDSVQCNIKKLDEFELSPLFIKIDVQGYELSVLRGGYETIANSKPILLIETRNPEIDDFLNQFGYQRYSYENRRFSTEISSGPNVFYLTMDKLEMLGGKS